MHSRSSSVFPLDWFERYKKNNQPSIMHHMDNAVSVQFIREIEQPSNKQGGMLSLTYISSIV